MLQFRLLHKLFWRTGRSTVKAHTLRKSLVPLAVCDPLGLPFTGLSQTIPVQLAFQKTSIVHGFVLVLCSWLPNAESDCQIGECPVDNSLQDCDIEEQDRNKDVLVRTFCLMFFWHSSREVLLGSRLLFPANI